MKKKILELLNSSNSEDVVLGLSIMVENNLTNEIFTEDYHRDPGIKILRCSIEGHIVVVYDEYWFHASGRFSPVMIGLMRENFYSRWKNEQFEPTYKIYDYRRERTG